MSNNNPIYNYIQKTNLRRLNVNPVDNKTLQLEKSTKIRFDPDSDSESDVVELENKSGDLYINGHIKLKKCRALKMEGSDCSDSDLELEYKNHNFKVNKDLKLKKSKALKMEGSDCSDSDLELEYKNHKFKVNKSLDVKGKVKQDNVELAPAGYVIWTNSNTAPTGYSNLLDGSGNRVSHYTAYAYVKESPL
jgi:hypothetical protein